MATKPKKRERALDDHQAEVLRRAGDVADELIAGLDRTGDPDSIVKADAYRAYSDRLHELADATDDPAAGQDDTSTAVASTLPGWLYRRFATGHIYTWGDLADADRSYWEHEAAAVRRAVARGGFKPTPSTTPEEGDHHA